MSIKLSALGRAARRFPRTHLILSGALVITVGLIALTPESGESRPERLQTLELPKPSASEELVRQESAQPVADVRAPAETPDEVNTLPSSTQRALGCQSTPGPWDATQ